MIHARVIDGERAALLDRAQVLGITLGEVK